MIKVLVIRDIWNNKTVNSKVIASINVDGEKLKEIPLKSGTRKVFSTLSIFTQQVLEVLSGVKRLLKEIKVIQGKREEAKVPLFADDMTVYISDSEIPLGNSYNC